MAFIHSLFSRRGQRTFFILLCRLFGCFTNFCNALPSEPAEPTTPWIAPQEEPNPAARNKAQLDGPNRDQTPILSPNQFRSMGWRWHHDDVSGDADRGLGDVPGLAAGALDEGSQCATRRVVQSRCHTEEVEPGRFVRKCEKTEQLLRDCVGRPSELVESKTEKTEEDVTDEMKNGSLSFGFPSNEPFAFPGLCSDIEALEKGFFGSLGSVLDEAERMTNDFFKSFGFPSTHERKSSMFPRPGEKHIEEGTAKKTKENDYTEFSGQITDV